MTDQSLVARPAREVRVVEDVIPILDTARFEHIQRIASAMASSSLIPKTLRGQEVDAPGNKKVFEPFDHQVVVANVFRIVSQAVGWNMNPFSVIDHCSVVHGRLMYEGKLIHAVVEARLGIRLRYVFGRMVEVAQPSGAKVLRFDPTEEGAGVNLAVQVIGRFDDEDEDRTIEGTVEQWKTSGNNSPWGNPLNFKRQLRYRGAREWSRAHSPGTILGVVTDDEIEDDLDQQERITTTRRGPRQKADLVGKLEGPKAQEGFDPDHVQRETATAPDGTEHDAKTGEIIEGKAEEVRPTETASVQSAEAEQATSASASDASDASPDPKVSGPQGSDEISTDKSSGDGPAAEDDDELEVLRQTAFEDGYQGEPVQAVLSECETDEERAIAAEEHERGRQARIEKDAADHAKSDDEALNGPAEEAEPEFEPEDVGGPAPKGQRYILQKDTVWKGMLPVYQDGKMVGKPVTVDKITAEGLKRYDAHPEPADPRLASQGGGTGVKAQEKPKGGLYEEIAAMDSWLSIKPRLGQLYQTDDFKALEPDDQARTRANLFGAVLEMKERTRDPVDWAADPSAFTLWADHTALGGDPDAADMIDGTFQTLQASAAFGRMKDEQKTTLGARVAGMIAKLKEKR